MDWTAMADATNVSASTISATGAVNIWTRTPATPGPVTSEAERPTASLLLASSNSARVTNDGSIDLLAMLNNRLSIPTARAMT